jgi:very-short-patch-repair endonuclease
MFNPPPRVDSGLRAALQDLSDKQQAIARRSQLFEAGLTRSALESMLTMGRWSARGDLVVVMHNGPLISQQELWLAVLNAGPVAALAARTAATDQGLVGWDAECIEVLVPRGTVVNRRIGIDQKIHESRRFSADDVHRGRGLPQVRIERALIDAATWSRNPRTACGVVAAGVQQRLTTAGRLFDELADAGQVRHRRLLAAALVDIEGGAHAVSEMDFLRFCRRNGLPKPEQQKVRREASGRRRYLDATFRRSDGRLVRVEVDGALHLVVQTYWNDMSRGNELVIDRELVLRFPSYVVYANDAAAVSQLRRALKLSEPQRHIAS